MRNPKSTPRAENNSWDKSDSIFYNLDNVSVEDRYKIGTFKLGPNDLDLACRLIKAGSEHAKFLRMIHVQMDITAPLYYWKEMDQYKTGTTTNSCSTMHRITSKPFTIGDFSCEHLLGVDIPPELENYNASHTAPVCDGKVQWTPVTSFVSALAMLNYWREEYIAVTKEGKESDFTPKEIWWQLIQLLPSSYNQLRTWDGSLQTVLTILKQRKGHKLDEWRTFRSICFNQIPYCREFYQALTGETTDD